MTKNELNQEYLDWMYQLVSNDRFHKNISRWKLVNHLHRIAFYYSIPMDANRAEDGINLRYRFGYERSHHDAVIARYLDDSPCSVLEMMIALAIRCEEQIMEDPDIGNRTGEWFWSMVGNLGLDGNYNPNLVDENVTRFLNRNYSCDGRGGLFTVKHPHRDMRSVELWWQMCWYINTILK